jgi:nicotinate phosphoribosyltransferase
MVYKLVQVDERPVEKRSADKVSHGGRKSVIRRAKASGTVTEEVIFRGTEDDARSAAGPHDRIVPVPLVRGGRPLDGAVDLIAAREHLRHALTTLPWEGLTLSEGEPAIPSTQLAAPPTTRD